MADWKPELYWLTDPEIHRQELFDCTPDNSPNREQFVTELVSRLYLTRIQPSNVQEVRSRAKGNPSAKEAKKKLETLRKANIEASKAIRELIDATSPIEEVSRSFSAFKDKTVQIGLLISRLEEDIERRLLGIPKDGRTKGLESSLVETTLTCWKAHFPEHPLPAKAMQGRLSGGHEACRPARLCLIVLEFMTGTNRNDISRLYEQAVARLHRIDQTPGMITLPL
ncbi:MAG: hypothetical protein ACYCYP_13390 [Leptospirales bacterium]